MNNGIVEGYLIDPSKPWCNPFAISEPSFTKKVRIYNANRNDNKKQWQQITMAMAMVSFNSTRVSFIQGEGKAKCLGRAKKETRIWKSLSLGKTQSWKFVKVFVICPNCNKIYLSKWTNAFVQN